MISRQDYVLITEVKDTHLCGICYELAINSMECSKCETLYCNQCAVDWQKKNDSCPNKCDGKFELKQAHRLIRAEISKMKCFCKNSKFGCQEQLILEQVINHLQQCQFMPIKCVEQCEWEGIAKDLQAHQVDCKFILDYVCTQCKQKVLKTNKETHNCFETIMNLFQNLQSSFQEYKAQSEIKITLLEKELIQQSRVQSEIVRQSLVVFEKQQEIEQSPPKESIIIKSQQPLQKRILRPPQQQQLQVPQQVYQVQGKLGDVSQSRMCKQKHNLRFWLAPGIDSSKQYCSKCLKRQICRYVCEQCSEYYCLICAPPENMCKGKGYPTQCPSGHKLLARPNSNYICDVCSVHGESIPNSKTLCCKDCDFDICQPCQENMMKNKDCVIF